MCLLCTEIQKGNMTVREVARAWWELPAESDHTEEVANLIEGRYSKEEFVEELLTLNYNEYAEDFT